MNMIFKVRAENCFSTDGWVISEAHIAYGGVAPKTIMAARTQEALINKPLTDETLQTALKAVAKDVNITANAPGGRPHPLSHISVV